MRTIKFKNQTWFQGRNGLFKCDAVEIMKSAEGHAMLAPITSKGKAGNCAIVIDADSVSEFIIQLAREFGKIAKITPADFRDATNTVCSKYLGDCEVEYFEIYKALSKIENKRFEIASNQEVEGEMVVVWQAIEEITVGDLLDLIDADLCDLGFRDDIELLRTN